MPLPSTNDFRGAPCLSISRLSLARSRITTWHKALADHFHLTEEERAIMDRGGLPKYKNLIAWAYVNLQKEGLCDQMTEAKEISFSANGKRDGAGYLK